jgi:hypothetical protein
MRRLDPRTLNRVAEALCDLGGPYERKGWELERLLRHAGWADPPPYDGSFRVPWLAEALEERADHPEDIARVLRRACDPREHDGSADVAEAYRAELNTVLKPEGLVITRVGGRPVLGQLGTADSMPVFGLPDDLSSRLARLIDDPQLLAILVDRADQSSAAQSAGAHLLAVIGIGSFVEGVLLAVLLHRDPNIALLNRRGQRLGPDNAGLESLLDAAHRDGHIALDAHAFLNPVRNFRNYIHPRRQHAERFNPDHETVSLCWGPVHAVLSDLEQSAPSS